jgi:aspartate kinase
MLMGYGFLARIFDVFARHRIVVNMVTTGEVSVSVTLDSERNLEAALEDLRSIGEVSVERAKAVVCVIGEGIKHTPGIAGDVFGALKEAGVNARMISQGASKINLSLVVEGTDCARAVQSLHRKFFDR